MAAVAVALTLAAVATQGADRGARPPGVSDTSQTLMSAEAAAKLKAEVPAIGSVSLSPDGTWVVYEVTRRSVAANETTNDHKLRRLAPEGDTAVVSLPAAARAVRWCPNSTCLSMILGGGAAESSRAPGFVRYDVATGTVTSIPVRDIAAGAGAPGERPRIVAMSENYAWSPRGTFVAFTAPLAEAGGLDPRRGVAQGAVERGARAGLFLLDVATGIVSQLTPDSLHVARFGGFDWAPDEHALAVTIDYELDSQGKNTDLVVVDRVSGTVRPLVTRAGMDGTPRWSPDGQWIAFSTHHGERSYQAGWPAVVAASGGPIVALPAETTPMGFGDARWSPDSRAFLYESNVDMAQVLVRADVAERTAAPLPAPPGHLALPFDSNRSLSADGRRMAFTRESATTPPDLFVIDLNADGGAAGAPRRLTALAPDFALSSLVHTEAVSWPSPDGRFTIHGLLFTPVSARRDGGVARPLPTLLKFIGGPSMVRRGFAADGWYGAHLPLAARGYAVLVPNTRGRQGYGPVFGNAIRDEKHRGRGPLADALAGLDLLVARGIADPAQVGVLGHSYGGYLTAYTITQTARFKGAVIHEGLPFYLTTKDYFGTQTGAWRELLARDLYGVHNPFDSAERARLIEESPALHAERVRTPTLLLYGSRVAELDGRPFFHSLRRFNVPSALFVYDEGHVFQRPAAIADDLTRTAEWLDYWVRGIPFPDAERAAEYGALRISPRRP